MKQTLKKIILDDNIRYTVLHNPNPNYDDVLHCAQEAVYPL